MTNEPTATPAPAMPRRALGIARSNRSQAFAEVEIREGGELSICATITDTAGNYTGGQCLDQIEAEAQRIASEPGGERLMSHVDLRELCRIWHDWHLNHMRAGCNHQRAKWNTSDPITFKTYSIEWDDMRRIERAATIKAGADAPRGDALARACDSAARVLMLTGAGIKPFAWVALREGWEPVLSRSFEIVTQAELAAYRAVAAKTDGYGVWSWRGKTRMGEPKPPVIVKTDVRLSGSVRPEEHPDGKLGKPCEVCGHKYGAAWLREELPAHVVESLHTICARALAAPSRDDAFAALGFSLRHTRIEKRHGRTDFGPGARHWECELSRQGRTMRFEYSQGSAHKKPPTLSDVIECLRSDASLAADESGAEACGVKPSQWEKLKRDAEAFRAVVGDAAEALGL